jgi:beta-glucosidase
MAGVPRSACALAIALVAWSVAPAALAESPDQRADAVVAQMTLPEKVALVTGTQICDRGADGRATGSSRLGIPDVKMVGAGQGVANVCAAGRGKTTGNTLLPAPLALAASWDEQTAYDSGRVIGRETRLAGMNTSIGGDVNLARDPRNGRTFEAEGEDPLLAGTIVGAQLRGTGDQHVVTTIKHFALNNHEADRGTQSSDVDERTMRELELRAFEIGIARSGAGAVMCSYNQVNDVNACENAHLLTDVLKRDWGFKGWVMSDWWACSVTGASAAPSGTCSTAKAADAGLDQEMPESVYFGPRLAAAVATGAVPARRLDDMVHRILRTMFVAGVIDDPPKAGPIDAQAGAADAQAIEERSAVLLRNEGGVLPLDGAAGQKIAVIGSPADEQAPQGAGSPGVTAARADTALGQLRQLAPAASVTFDDGSDPVAAASAAKAADVAVVFARDSTSEGVDRPDLSLPVASHRCTLAGCYDASAGDDVDQDDLIAAVAKANPRTVVVLMTGGPVTMPWVHDVAAVLEAWYPGESYGHAVARLLLGQANPSGRLPITFPVSERDLPTAPSLDMWPGDASHIEYREGVFSGYRHYDENGIAPLFAFGFGLSYGARFTYSGLRIDGDTVGFTVTNDGTRAADEVPQLYLGLPDPTPAVRQPPRSLQAFAKFRLDPGASREVTFRLDRRAFSYWDSGSGRWAVAPGCESVQVGSSSRDIRLTGAICP